jgi:ribosome-binding protein aMBF1 (putative translation factor)
MTPQSPHPLPRTSLEPVCEAVAAVIRRRRERAGLSLNQLAERTRLSRQMLNLVESESWQIFGRIITSRKLDRSSVLLIFTLSF